MNARTLVAGSGIAMVLCGHYGLLSGGSNVRAATTRLEAAARDEDGDGVPDAREDALALRFAPIVYHAPGEQYRPTSVDAFLRLAPLWFYDDDCEPDHHERVGITDQARLVSFSRAATCGSSQAVRSGGTRSRRKQLTWYLDDVATLPDREGASDPSAWRTYVHAYPNDRGGVTLQYWRLYAYNGQFPEHGGDWEGIHVVLDRADRPIQIRMVGHRVIHEYPPGLLAWENLDGGQHPTVFAGRGGHTSWAWGSRDGVRHETWRRGGLLNVGEKTRPLHGQQFVRYSGLWGAPGTLYETGGYWGPAYNETGLDDATGFVTAWCEGIRDPERVVDGVRECYPTEESR